MSLISKNKKSGQITLSISNNFHFPGYEIRSGLELHTRIGKNILRDMFFCPLM